MFDMARDYQGGPFTSAHSESEQLARLAGDLVAIEKIASGEMPFAIRPLHLGSFLDETLELNRGLADAHSATIVLNPVPENAFVLADEDRLGQLIDNLLSNAIKFSPEGGEIELSVAPFNHGFRISVADQGPGISPDFHARIFTPFAQANPADSRHGCGVGLGLAIAREIAVRMEGAISFESEAGKGAIFHVYLPAPDSTAT